MQQSLIDFDLSSFANELEQLGYLRRHAPAILRAFHAAGGRVALESLCIPKSLRALLQSQYARRHAHLIARHISTDGTIKLLLGFENANGGGAAEAVLMPSPAHRQDASAGCVSSQIGCAMGCDFCASTRTGLERNLGSGEIVEQVLHLRDEANALKRRLRTLVFMGMGEPMHNLDNVICAIQRIAHPQMGALGWRQITVSTVGIVPGIDKLADSGLGVHLALSLHAPDDATRAQIVPANRRYPVAEIIAAARRYQALTRRVVNIEYCLLGDVNDSDDQARLLGELLAGFRAHVNLIPYNAIGGAGISGRIYQRPSDARVDSFLTRLRDKGVISHVRVKRGDDVSAACGQLRRITSA
jgi:23S rRNA (adenine2503-C2)-methyltransferase